jgi:hypothetical protein
MQFDRQQSIMQSPGFAYRISRYYRDLRVKYLLRIPHEVRNGSRKSPDVHAELELLGIPRCKIEESTVAVHDSILETLWCPVLDSA